MIGSRLFRRLRDDLFQRHSFRNLGSILLQLSSSSPPEPEFRDVPLLANFFRIAQLRAPDKGLRSIWCRNVKQNIGVDCWHIVGRQGARGVEGPEENTERLLPPLPICDFLRAPRTQVLLEEHPLLCRATAPETLLLEPRILT